MSEQVIDKVQKEQEVNEYSEIIVIEKLFGQCFVVQELKAGAPIPVGGGSIFSDEVNIHVVGDFEALEPTLIEMHETAGKYNLSVLEDWLQSQEISIDEQLFAKLFAFAKVLEKRYPATSDVQTAREEKYYKNHDSVKLSELFASNTIACAEIAALAQYYLQNEGVESRFFSGDVLWDRDREFSEKHSFIVIPQGDTQIIFDPANPTNTTQGLFPSIYTVNINFEEAVRQNKKAFVEATNILSKSKAYFGVNNGTDLAKQNFVNY